MDEEGGSVIIFLKGLAVTLPCSHRSTYFLFNVIFGKGFRQRRRCGPRSVRSHEENPPDKPNGSAAKAGGGC